SCSSATARAVPCSRADASGRSQRHRGACYRGDHHHRHYSVSGWNLKTDGETRMTQDETKVINRIQEAIQGPQKVPASEVKNWLRHPSLDVLSVATDL